MSPAIAFKTPRLTVEDWRSCVRSIDGKRNLAEQLKPVLTPPVLRHLPPSFRLAGAENAVETWIDERSAESDVMTIRDAGGSLLGLLILARTPGPGRPVTVHIGYLLSEAAWGKGYATELIEGLVNWYRGQGDAVQLLGGVAPENTGSERVLIKNGFARDNALSGFDVDMYGLYIA